MRQSGWATFLVLVTLIGTTPGSLVAQQSLPTQARRTPLDWSFLSPEWANCPSVRLSEDSQLFFRGTRFSAYSLSQRKAVQFGDLTSWPKWPPTWTSVTAAARFDADTIVLINSDQWVPYSVSKKAITDVPRLVRAWKDFPFTSVDAAVSWSPDTILIFQGTKFVRYRMTPSGNAFDLVGDATAWQNWPSEWTQFGSALSPGDGLVYFFRGSEVLAFDSEKNAFNPVTTYSGTPVPTIVARVTPEPKPPVEIPTPEPTPLIAPAPDITPPSPDVKQEPIQAPPSPPKPKPRKRNPRATENVDAEAKNDPPPRPAEPPADKVASTPPAPPVEPQPPQPKGPNMNPPEAPAGMQLLALTGEGRQGLNVAANPALVPGQSGAIDFWMAPRWEPQTDPNAQARLLLSFGSMSRMGWSIYVSSDLDRILFSNGPNMLEGWPGIAELRDGKLHHYALVTKPLTGSAAGQSSSVTQLFVDGKPQTELQVGYAPDIPTLGLPLSIAPAPFVGFLGTVRLFSSALPIEKIRESYAGGENIRELAGYLKIASASSGSFEILPKAYRAEAVWAKDGEMYVQTSRNPKDPAFVFVPQSLLHVRSTPGGSVLVIQDSRAGENAVPQVREFAMTGRNEFTPALRLDGPDSLLLEGVRYRRVTGVDGKSMKPFIRAGQLNEFKLNSLQASLQATEMAYDVRSLDPWDYKKSGSQRKLFVHDDPLAQEFKAQSDYKVPVGLQYEQISDSKSTDDSNATTSAREYHETALRGIGMSAEVSARFLIVSANASFSMNEEFSRATSEMYRTSLVRTLDTRICRSYALVLDRANARISPDFVEAVQALKAGTLTMQDFVRTWGTHYAHAVVFGAKAVRETTIAKQYIEKQMSAGRKFEAAAHVGVSIGNEKTRAEGGGGVGASGKEETSAKSTSAEESEQVKTQTIAAGHKGTFEAFACGDTTTIVPVHLDLRPVSELLATPFFDDPAILTELRPRLEAELLTQLGSVQPPSAEKVFDRAAYEQRLAADREAANKADQEYKEKNEKPCKQITYAGEGGYKVTFELTVPALKHGESFKLAEGCYSDGDAVIWDSITYTCTNGKLQLFGPGFEHYHNKRCSKGNYNFQQQGMKLVR